ncbi:MAG: putative transrane protein [Phenylobacterium sp.]|nr:putative transrane protein [Phenylobacterium sp.]
MARARPWRIGGAAALLLALDWPARANFSADRGDLELAVKAAYLYKLAPFVAWPAAAFGAAEDPLVICIQGADPFGGVVDRAVAGRRFGRHPMVVRRIPRLERRSGCHIAYVAGSGSQSPAQALAAVDRAPVLTVTDSNRGPAKGVVHLVRNGGKVRFAINVARAQACGLGISSKLRALAVEAPP